MKTGPKQLQLRDSHHAKASNPCPIRAQSCSLQKRSTPFPPFSPIIFFPIRVYPCPSVVKTPLQNKNYQTNPFVIFRFARKYSEFSAGAGSGSKKRTHFVAEKPLAKANCVPHSNGPFAIRYSSFLRFPLLSRFAPTRTFPDQKHGGTQLDVGCSMLDVGCLLFGQVPTYSNPCARDTPSNSSTLKLSNSKTSPHGFLLEGTPHVQHIVTRQGPRNVDLRTPPGPEGSNGSLLDICRGHPGISF